MDSVHTNEMDLLCFEFWVKEDEEENNRFFWLKKDPTNPWIE